MDVHKESIDIATADAGRDDEVRHVCSLGGDLVGLDKALRRLISKGIACTWSTKPARAGS